MKTISLRFTDKFSPSCGTIVSHQKLINEFGYVWYGKLGSPLSNKNIALILSNPDPMFLLIHSGFFDRYWVHVSDITKEQPPLEKVPEYYRSMASDFKTWFKVTNFEVAPKDVVSKCIVVSSGSNLSFASKHSMSPYFVIEYRDEI